MILQQLAQDADCIVGEVPPSMYRRVPVKWILDLGADGSLQGVVATTGAAGSNDRGNEILVPALPVKRTSGVRPTLLADTPVYTLGLPLGDDRAAQKHDAYRTLIAACAAETGSSGVKAVERFLQWWDQEPPSADRLNSEMGAGDLVTFRVNGDLVADDPAVRQFWARRCAAAGEGSEARPTQCLVCGQRKPLPPALPEPLKGIPGGQSSGVPLVCINSEAFESFGLARASSAGVCQECGEKVGKALNALLSRDDSHLPVGPLVYVFWTRDNAGFSPVSFLNKPDPKQVKELLTAYRAGPTALAVDEMAFHATALGASSGRAVVRDWLHTTLGHAKANLARWFDLLRQVDAYGQPGRPLGVFPLAAALYHDANKEMAAQVPRALVRAALHGSPLPSGLLAQAVNRCRIEQKVTYPRAALIKAALVSEEPGKEAYMSELEPKETRPPYLCGRLLAVLEEIQREANPNINATLVDRFYGAASTAPGSVFGHLLSGAQAHLSKLRRTEVHTYRALQQRLEEVMCPLRGFPRTLSLHDQALFSLGYYHQRAAHRAAIQARRTAKPETADTDSSTEETTHE